MKSLVLVYIGIMAGLTGGSMNYIASEKSKFLNEAYILLMIGGVSMILCTAFYYLLEKKESQ